MIRLRGARTRAVGGDPAALRVTAHHDDCFDGRTRAGSVTNQPPAREKRGSQPGGARARFLFYFEFLINI
jgi:hypothetical protein